MILSPKNIIDEVKKRPSFQREYAELSYRGMKVSWKLKFHSVKELENGLLKVIAFGGDSYPKISFDVDKKIYPALESFQENQIIRVAGEIAKIKEREIDLVNCAVKFTDEEPKEKILTKPVDVKARPAGGGDIVERRQRVKPEGKPFWLTFLTQILVGLIVAGIIALIAYLLK